MRRSPAPTQRLVNTNQRRRRIRLRLRQLLAGVQHFAFGVEHDQKIGHAGVEPQAGQLRRFLRAEGGGQQAFGARSLSPTLDECTRAVAGCAAYAMLLIAVCARPLLAGGRFDS
jgi:hypothetical protein